MLYTLDVDDRPGTLGRVAGVLHEAGINIDGFSAGKSGLVIVTGDEGTDACLSAAGIGNEAREVIGIDLPNRPGELARVATALGEHGVNIEVSLGTGHDETAGSVYIAVDDVDAAWEALETIPADH